MKHACKERVRFLYQKFLLAGGADRKTVDAKLATLSIWDEVVGPQHYLCLNVESVELFRRFLPAYRNPKTGLGFSASSIRHHVANMLCFFLWLSRRKDFEGLDLEAVACLSTANGLRGAGRLIEEKPVHEIETYVRAINNMPANTLPERCHRAILSLLLLTGVRISALTTLCLRHVDLKNFCVHQDAAQVAVKNGKSQITYFFALCKEAESALTIYCLELQRNNYPLDGLLFPSDRFLTGLDQEQIPVSQQAAGVRRSNKSIRQLLADALAAIAAPYTHPHQIRKTIAQHYAALPLTEEERVAITINLGHEPQGTTNRYYARPSTEKRGRVIRSIGLQSGADLSTASKDDLLAELKRRMA
jgi:integrase